MSNGKKSKKQEEATPERPREKAPEPKSAGVEYDRESRRKHERELGKLRKPGE